ncbi:MAG: STAS domain-containing protein [Spirochaetales bacterium]
MEIHVENHDPVVVAKIEGEIDLFHSKMLKEQFNKFVADNEDKICFDFQDVSYIDSSGIGALLYMFSESKKRNVGLCYARVHGSMLKVIELTKLTRYLPLVDDVESGIAKLQA